MFHYFTLLIYQPFFNLLVFFYWGLEFITGGHADMGVAVIFLTIVIRILLLPLSLAEHKSAKERKEISEKIREIEAHFAHDPIGRDKAKKEVMRTNRRILIAEIINLSVQVAIALMLWRMFKTGLSGADLHLLYHFMPTVEQPFNLVFWGKFDLTHSSLELNLIQSFLIFLLETISMYGSEDEVSRTQVVRLQLILPLVSFFVFLFLPAGKKLFVITSLIFSIILTLYRTIKYRFELYKERHEKLNPTDPSQTPIVVDVK